MFKSVLSIVAITLVATLFAAPSFSFAATTATPVVSQMFVPISGSFLYQPVANCNEIVISISGTVNILTVSYTSPQSGRQVMVLSNLSGVWGAGSNAVFVTPDTVRFSTQPLAPSLSLEANFTLQSLPIEQEEGCCSNPCSNCCLCQGSGDCKGKLAVVLSLTFDSLGNLTGASATPVNNSIP